MLMFTRPADAIEFGLAMERFVDAEPHFPALHIGAHHGNVLYRDGDYVGGTINLAARVAAAGSAGQFLITEELRDAAGDVADADIMVLAAATTQRYPRSDYLNRLRHASPQHPDRETDPVCGLLLSPKTWMSGYLARNYLRLLLPTV